LRILHRVAKGLQQVFVAEYLHPDDKNLTSPLTRTAGVAKALLDNASPFTIFMLSTRGFSGPHTNASAPHPGKYRLPQGSTQICVAI
jgi:hypothetical protein